MKRTLCFLMCMILLMLSFGTVSAKGDIEYIKATPLAVLEEENNEVVAASYDEVRIIVAFIENAEESAKKVKTASYYEQLMQNIYLFVFDSSLEALEAYDAFKNDENVKSVSYDVAVGIDPIEEEYIKETTKNYNIASASSEETSKPNDYDLYTSQWYLDDVGAYDAWQAIEENFPDAKDNSVIVAVIDSGIDTSSPDLQDAILTDENGNYVGFNTISSTSTSFEDDYADVYHGTAVSSFIAAKSNNGYGICGVTGDYNVKILPIKALNSNGGGSMASIIKAFDLAVENGADIINMSLTAVTPLYTFSQDGTQITGALHEAINLATENGVCVVASAGNYYSNYPLYPASYDNVLAVSAYTSTREKADFSQYNDYVDISAPGKSMAHINKSYTDCVKENGSGTSYAAPLVSGAAALLKLAYPEITPREISNFIKTSTTDLGKDGYDQIFGHGALDIEGAIKKLSQGGYSPITSITYPESMSVKVGEHKQIETKVLPVYASNKKVRYESFDTSIATVSNNGVVYGVGPGVVDVLIIPDDTEESYYTTVYVHPDPTVEPDMEYVRQTGEMLSKIDITGDEFLFYAGDYLWHGEKDLLDGTAVIKPTMNMSGDYAYCTALPKNKENTYSAMYSYSLFSTSLGKFIFSNSPYFPKGRLSMTDPAKSETENYLDFANNGSSILAVTDLGRCVSFAAPYMATVEKEDGTTEQTLEGALVKSYGVILPDTEQKVVINKISYISHEKCGYFIATGKSESGDLYILTTEDGVSAWGSIPFSVNETKKDVKSILVDGQYVYFLTDDALYTIMTGRVNGGMAAAGLQKIYDVDATNIKDIMFYTQDDKIILVGLTNDNKLCAIADDGTVVDFNTNMENVSSMFTYLNDVYMISDGSLKTTNIYMFAKNRSLAPEFLSYDVNIIDKNNNLVSSPTTDGKFTIEYYIESISPIEFDNEKYSTTNTNAHDKYPAQVVFAVYERVTDKLVDIKMRNFVLDYNKNADVGALLRWEEPFDIGEGNYYVKVMTYKGNSFYWPERDNSGTTLDVFTQQYRK